MTTVLDDEIKRFSALANEWWDETGSFKALHAMNKARFNYLTSELNNHFNNNLNNKTALDLGCGGGLVSEFLAKKSITVTAVDPSPACIAVSKIHAEINKLNINYLNITPEETSGKYDIVLALEVIEHVNDVESFLSIALDRLNPNGILFVSSINRNIKSLLLAKFAAEYVLKWLPKNTHNYKKFVKPAEVSAILEKNNYSISNLVGMKFDIFTNSWVLSQIPDVNYILTAKKSS